MGQVDALKLVEEVRRRMVELAVSDNYIRDDIVAAICRHAWEGSDTDGGLVSEIWVEGAFPAEKARNADSSERSLGDVVADGQFPRDLAAHLDRRGSCPLGRPLFSHQEQSIALAGQGTHCPALVVTAPTGAGKTEAFLLPVLKDLWSNPKRTPGGGMRCLILYPMNALVTDQVERLYGWLRGQEKLSVFHFNSETPEDTREAIRWGEPRWEKCRKRTRQEARGLEDAEGRSIRGEVLPPPDIVITNYSMLEYMLCRPRDACFFGRDLRAIVLDEAHLYSGTLAAEITLLLRRVRLRCGVQPDALLQIATSATLGGDDQDLKAFAGHLFAREQREVVVVRGHPAPLELPGACGPEPSHVSASMLAENADMELSTLTPKDDFVRNADLEVSGLADLVKTLTAAEVVNAAVRESPDVAAPFLKRALERSPITQKLAQELFARKIVGLPSLAGALWRDKSATALKATTLLLRLCAAARNKPDALPLIPHRLHFLVRGPEALSCCLNEACSGPQQSVVPRAGALQTEADRCRYCLSATLPLHRCQTCGEWALVAFANSQDGLLEPGYFVAPGQRSFYLLLKRTAAPLLEIRVDPTTGEFGGSDSPGTLLFKAPCPEHGSECRDPGVCSQQECPTCHRAWTVSALEEEETSSDRNCVPIRSGDRLGISVVAETMLHGLPHIGGHLVCPPFQLDTFFP